MKLIYAEIKNHPLIATETMLCLIDNMYDAIGEYKSKNKITGKYIVGGFMVEDIKLKDGSIKNIWIDYYSENTLGVMDVKVGKLIIFDKNNADEMLDRINLLRLNVTDCSFT